jgi:cysteinyl-tRNA synthetase
VDPGAFRLLAFQTHYRKELNYGDDALRAAVEGGRRLGELRRRLKEAAGEGPPGALPAEGEALVRDFAAALDDDLNTPEGVATLFTFAKAANRALDEGAWSGPAAAAALSCLDRILDVLDILPQAGQADAGLVQWVERLVAEREAARKARDFGRADALRKELAGRGVELEDTPAGPRWRLARPT